MDPVDLILDARPKPRKGVALEVDVRCTDPAAHKTAVRAIVERCKKLSEERDVNCTVSHELKNDRESLIRVLVAPEHAALVAKRLTFGIATWASSRGESDETPGEPSRILLPT